MMTDELYAATLQEAKRRNTPSEGLVQPASASLKHLQDLVTKDRMAVIMQKTFEECDALRNAAHEEYAHTADALANFKRIGATLELPPEKILWVYLQKHIDGITAHINGHRSQREPVSGRIKDAIVYLCLLRAMVDRDV